MKKIYTLFFALGLGMALPTAATDVLAATNTSVAGAQAIKSEDVTTAAEFTDIPNSHWAKNEVMQLVEMGIMTGYGDMQFRPDIAITVGEAAHSFTKAGYESLIKDVVSTPFSVDVPLTRKQMESALVQAFNLQSNGEVSGLIDWSSLTSLDKGSVGIVPQYGTLPGTQNGLFNPETTVDRATFAVILHKALVESGKIVTTKKYELTNIELSANFIRIPSTVNLMKVSFDEHPIYLRSTESILFMNHTRIDNSFSRDNIYTYNIGGKGATIELTVRSFDNGDYFLFSKISNPSKSAVTVDVIQKENDVSSFELKRYDRYKIKRNDKDVFGSDTTSYPTGLLRFVKQDGSVKERMVGQSYLSKQLSLEYENDGYSYMRQLLVEKEALSYAQVGTTLLSVHTLESKGNDIVDQWYMNADGQLFENEENMESWMKESAEYYKKRNNWYTASGPYNKMATTTEPMPDTGQGYGRNLLLLKEDRALVLYNEQEDRYFENLIYNSFVNLKNFKGDKDYWETEVTSTYLKDLYDITAPFIDTRFNEQIALFYYNSGDDFGIENAKEPLRNYADLLVSQKSKGNVIPVNDGSHYISDYFPIAQDVTTHASMNHVLGGMNILLMAYNEFKDEKYLDEARAIQTAIAADKDDWLRESGDIWYRISPMRDYKGDDYKHLTLEDLINSYKLWRDIDPTYLPLLEEMIASKASFLSNEKLGYTTKIKNGLRDIGLLQYLPKGEERTDAL
ncbi:S-layer homology domain-containing protein [Sporosarcina sp. ANT_H38]|uniref:S-layer homology domain-containing protein n=1 Tax=Sporosarcina sp. ANT_H38 TaxID=2597358 RepID=UPI0011F26A63|nr:S-layer homology domain-containing protein [Sporosarcina sp. ANT_H38]KAA0964874.1 S-layer homology domain-containing protein [Sporosarcina sp. ANT_H38]